MEQKKLLDLPRFSLQERDRRWRAVRDAMTMRGLDCLVVHGDSGKWDSNTAEVRYLTQIGGNGEEAYVLFPLEGDVTCWIWIDYYVEWWKKAQDWVEDIRVGCPSWSSEVVKEIKRRGLEKGRIGVVGLGGLREPEGKISYTTFSRMKEELPHADFQNATDILETVMLVKSPAEIAFIEKAAEIADIAIEAMMNTARPGVKEYEVYAEMVYAMLKAGSENPVFLLWEAGPEIKHVSRFPTARPLQKGDIITNEISPRYGGYWAHPHQPIAIGEPREEYQEMFDVALEAFNLSMQILKPGITLGEFARPVHELVEKRGYIQPHPLVHGCGLAMPDFPYAPILGQPSRRPQDNLIIKPGMTFALEPLAAKPENVPGKWLKGIPIGDTVVVTENGCRRLSKRELGFPRVG